jgi:hypothetical protein
MKRRNVEIVIETRGASSVWDQPAGSPMTEAGGATGVEGA